ncbi:hypothetical protein [Hyalangium gracile]|uniref:hypothetical protein n=1 Tax=Hyalangium gracile TaxID=394092 RepID=UPI001CCB3300|nr:hypothetical protein [Hyalangium gracile]
MSKRLVAIALLSVVLGGWKAGEPGTEASYSTTSTTTPLYCMPEELAVPTAPTLQEIPDTGVLPTIPASSHIVVIIYPRGGGWAAVGANKTEGTFTFLFKGRTPSLGAAITRLYSTGVPVIGYTAPLRLLPAVAYTPPPPRTSSLRRGPTALDPRDTLDPEPPGGEGDECQEDADTVCDPPRTPIGDDPPPGGDTPGGDDWLLRFLRLAWKVSVYESKIAVQINAYTP